MVAAIGQALPRPRKCSLVSVDQIGLILLVACVVAMITRRLNLPYTVGLVSAGIALTWLGGADKLVLTPHLVFEVLLPPLLFEAAMHLKWRPFRRDLPVSATLAFPGTILTATIIAAGMRMFVGWPWISSGLFGFLIAATDPVSVIAAFKSLKVAPRLALLVESESLMNDGAAAVGFAILVTLAQGAAPDPAVMAQSLAWMVLGGLVVGAAVAGCVLLLAGRTQDPLVEIALTVIAAYGSFLAAEHFHMSGVLACVLAGLMVGNFGGLGALTEQGRAQLLGFWEFAAFLANSVVFILLGGHAAHHGGQLLTVTSATAVGLVLFGQAAAVYPLCLPFIKSKLRVDIRYQHVMFWGGLRGAISLALALGIPDSVPEKEEIILAAFAVVAFSIFVQGLSMPWLIRGLGLTEKEPSASPQPG